MKKLVLILILVFIILEISYSCQCPPPYKLENARAGELNGSDYIIIGLVTSISEDNKKLTVEIKEVFKDGLMVGKKLTINNNIWCEPEVEELGEWLIYGKIKEEEFFINECGLSRSIEKPFKNNFLKYYPSLPLTLYHYDTLIYDKIKIINEQKLLTSKQDAFVELEKELEMLRKYKNNEE